MVLGIAMALVVFGVITCKVDYTRVRENKEPIFCIKLASIPTGKVTYFGFVYKVIRYTTVFLQEPFQNNAGVKFGHWVMNY